MPTLHYKFALDSACEFERCLQPTRFCVEEMAEHGVHLDIGSLIGDAEWIGFHGLPYKYDDLFQLVKAKDKGSKLLWSLDDDFLTIPDWNPAKMTEDGRAMWTLMRSQADAIMCSTDHLATKFDPYWNAGFNSGKPVFSCPNLLDLDKFPVPKWEADNNGFVETDIKFPIRIMWSGGITHKGDLEFLTPALDKLLRKYGSQKIAVIFQGSTPPPSQLTRDWLHRGVLWQPGVPFAQYRKITNSIEPHVWLAPLADIEFNKSKSNLRVMEGWALNSLVVASPVGEYNCIRHGEDGLLAKDNSEEAWFEVLERAVLDHENRIQMAAQGRSRIRATCDWNLRPSRLRWLKAYGNLFNVNIE